MKKKKIFWELSIVKKSGDNPKPDIYNKLPVAEEEYNKAKHMENIALVTLYKCSFVEGKLERQGITAQWKSRPSHIITENDLKIECGFLKNYYLQDFSEIRKNFHLLRRAKFIHKDEKTKLLYTFSLTSGIDRIAINEFTFLIYLNEYENPDDYKFPDCICGFPVKVFTMSDWNKH